MSEIVADYTLDVRGECCPYPLIRTKKQVESIQRGEIVKIIANDPVAPQNIDSWAKKSGNKLLLVEKEGENFIIYIERV